MRAGLPKTVIVLAAFLVAGITSTRAADSNLQTQAQQTLHTFVQKDPSLEKFIENSAGYAVFPGVGEGGFIVGGARGKGVVFQNGKPVGEAVMTKATIGAQAGGQSFAEVIFFQTPEALRQFKGSNFEMSAGVSGVVAAEGAAKSANYQQGVAVFTMPKSGVMAQAAIGGQKFKFEPYE